MYKRVKLGDDEYKIFINDIEKYHARWASFFHLAEIQLFDEKDNTIFIINKVLSLFKKSYNILRCFDEQKFYFRTVSSKKKHYKCFIENDKYEVYQTTKSAHEFHRNEIKIGQLEEISEDNLKLKIMDIDAYETLIIFSLIIHNAFYYYYKSNIDIYIDIGI